MQFSWSKWTPAVLLSAIIFGGAPVLANHVDSIYPTGSTWWICGDGQSGSLPGKNLFCLSDYSTDLTYYVEFSIGDTGWGRIVNTLQSQYDPTDLNTVDQEWTGGPVYSGNDQTDIIYQYQSGLPSNVLAVTYCDAMLSFTRCDQHYVVIKTSLPTTDTICHETGHAVGLTHGAQAYPPIGNADSTLNCMRTSNTGDATLGSHNLALINENY